MKRKIKLLISLFYLCFLVISNFFLKIFKTAKPKLIILYYHSIPNDKISIFKWQMSLLSRVGNCVNSDFTSSYNLNKRCFAVTFDDGFNSVINNALPELEKLQIPCTIFIPANYLGKNPAWDIKGEFFDSKEEIINPERLVSLNQSLVKIGSHSLNHSDFTLMNSDIQKMEFIKSKNILEDLVKYSIDLFSFPYGAYNTEAINNGFASGYKFIYTSDPAFCNFSGFLSPTVRGRIPADTSDSKLEFFVKIFGGYTWIAKYINFKKKLKSNF